MRLFAFILNGPRTRVNGLRPPLMKELGSFIRRWNPNGWIWQPVRRSSSVWICFCNQQNFASVYLRLICVPFVMGECCLRPSIQPLCLKSTSSDADVAAPSIRDVFSLMTSRVDGGCAPSRPCKPGESGIAQAEGLDTTLATDRPASRAGCPTRHNIGRADHPPI